MVDADQHVDAVQHLDSEPEKAKSKSSVLVSTKNRSIRKRKQLAADRRFISHQKMRIRV
jgi:hypothetical protein